MNESVGVGGLGPGDWSVK